MNPFYGAVKADLEQWLSDAREEVAGGKTLSQFGAGDTSGAFMTQRSLPPERRIELLWAELSRIDPDHYAASAMRRVRVTAQRFYDL
jgi:hypothetical protein